MKKLTNKQRCGKCIHKKVCEYQSYFINTEGIDRCNNYSPKANKGNHKQSEGEWIVTYNNGFWHYDCPFCDDGYAQEAKLPISNYCANCGARLNEPKMKGGEGE